MIALVCDTWYTCIPYMVFVRDAHYSSALHRISYSNKSIGPIVFLLKIRIS